MPKFAYCTDILCGICTDILCGICTDILCGICTDILCCICTDILCGICVTQLGGFLFTSEWLYFVSWRKRWHLGWFISHFPWYFHANYNSTIASQSPPTTAAVTSIFLGGRRPGLGASSGKTALPLFALWLGQLNLYLYHSCLLRLCNSLNFMESKKICPLTGALKSVWIELVVAY